MYERHVRTALSDGSAARTTGSCPHRGSGIHRFPLLGSFPLLLTHDRRMPRRSSLRSDSLISLLGGATVVRVDHSWSSGSPAARSRTAAGRAAHGADSRPAS